MKFKKVFSVKTQKFRNSGCGSAPAFRHAQRTLLDPALGAPSSAELVLVESVAHISEPKFLNFCVLTLKTFLNFTPHISQIQFKSEISQIFQRGRPDLNRTTGQDYSF